VNYADVDTIWNDANIVIFDMMQCVMPTLPKTWHEH